VSQATKVQLFLWVEQESNGMELGKYSNPGRIVDSMTAHCIATGFMKAKKSAK